MKYTIHGFSQQEAVKFKKIIEDKNGKEKEIKIDCTDLLILRWFVDFYPKMMKVEVDGVQYAWLQYQAILKDLPLLDIKKQALFDRLQKMCEFGILKHKTVKVNGTFSYYGFGEMYGTLIDTECSQIQEGEYSTNEGVGSQINKGTYSTNEQINPSSKNQSVIDKKSIKEKKERKKETTYDDILSAVEDVGLRETYYEFIKMRKLIKSPMTDKALTMLIDKVKKLEPTDINRQKRLLETAIMNNWKSVYPLKDNDNAGGFNNGTSPNGDTTDTTNQARYGVTL